MSASCRQVGTAKPAISPFTTKAMNMTTVESNSWGWSLQPPSPGWYATKYGWDVEEGTFVGAHEWDGLTWSERLPFIARSMYPFPDKDSARIWADAHDPVG
jgi:hypothetical protein